jgi:hypothetical protein
MCESGRMVAFMKLPISRSGAVFLRVNVSITPVRHWLDYRISSTISGAASIDLPITIPIHAP